MGHNNPESWQYAMIVIAIFCFSGFLLCFSMTCEHVKSAAAESIGKDIKSLVCNVPWWILNGAALLSNLFSTVRGATAAYFLRIISVKMLFLISVSSTFYYMRDYSSW